MKPRRLPKKAKSAPTEGAELLAQFVACFSKFDEMEEWEDCGELTTEQDEQGWYHWRPRAVETDRGALERLYLDLGLSGRDAGRFPPLYERLILSYRWKTVDLGRYRLMGNEPANDLSPLRDNIRKDKALFTNLTPHGYMQFGFREDVNYDPVCFDLRQRQKDGDCPIVATDHEEILCFNRLGEIREIAPSFRALAENTIREAAQRS